MPAHQLVILLSVGSFQATLPTVGPQPSPTFPDTAEGSNAFVREWLKPTLPSPKFAEPPLKVCVVGVQPFPADKPPYLPQPLSTSKAPFRSFEPYSASFHYVEPPASGKPAPKPRTMRDAIALCAAAAKLAPTLPAALAPSAPASPSSPAPKK